MLYKKTEPQSYQRRAYERLRFVISLEGEIRPKCWVAVSAWSVEVGQTVDLIQGRIKGMHCIVCSLSILCWPIFILCNPPPLLPGIIIAWAFCPSPAPLSFFLLLFSKKCRKWFEWHIYMWAVRIQRIAINPSFLESQLVPDNLGLEIFRDHLKGVT